MTPVPFNVALLISPHFLYPISQPTMQPSSQPSSHSVLFNPLIHYSLTDGIAGLTNTGTAGSSSTITMTPPNGVTFDTGAAFFNNGQTNNPPETNYLVANTQWVGSSMTFAFWFKTDCLGNYYTIAGICGNEYPANSGLDSVQFDLTDANTLIVYTAMSGSYQNWVVQLGHGKSLSSFGYQCGAWTHVAFTADVTNYQASLYVNGALYDSGTGTGPLPSGRFVSLGGSCDARGFHGYLKDARMYATVLSASQIVQQMNSQLQTTSQQPTGQPTRLPTLPSARLPQV